MSGKRPFFLFKQNGAYWARKRRKGHPDKYLDCETSLKGLAAERAQAWVEGLIADSFGEKPRKTFAEAAEKMILEHIPHRKYKTQIRYSSVLDVMTDEFDDKRLDQIDTAAIYEYEKRRRKSVSPATIGFELRVLSVLYGLCDAWGWHDKNPVQSYKRRAKVARRDISSRNERNRYLTHDEERALLLAAPEAWKWRIVFAIETGLRKEEQFGLPWSQVDLKAKHLRITAEMAKNGKERFVPLTARAIQAATQMRVKGSEWVCPRPDGERFAWNSPNIWRGLQAIAETANINNLNWHDLRRTCGCRLLQDRELSMEAVQRWLGHASITTTERVYAFLKVDNLKRMIERTEKLALSNKDEGYR